MPHIEANPEQKFILLQEIVVRIKKENYSLKDPDIIKKGIKELRVKLELKNKSVSAFADDMKKIIAEMKKDHRNIFPLEKPSI